MMTLRYVILLTSAAGIVVWLVWLRRNPHYRWAVVAPISWLLFVAAFHIIRLLDIHISIETLNIMGASLQLLGCILLICGAVIYRRGPLP